MVKKMARSLEAARRQAAEEESAEGSAGETGALVQQRNALLKEEAVAKPRDLLMEKSEEAQIAALKREVSQMKEEERVVKLKEQVHRLKQSLGAEGYQGVRKAFGLPTHSPTNSLAGSDSDASSPGDTGRDTNGADAEKTPKLPEFRKMRVCDGFGCHTRTLPQANPPHVIGHKTIEQQLEGNSLMDTLFPDPHTWEPEVHLNAKGQIRADHDDPNGHLMPRNKYQHAEYPSDDGGDAHVRRAPEDVRPGLTNQVGSHLFSDSIVTAAPGFNAGTGRHIRAQEGLDWERNWETHRESKTGRVPSSSRFPRNGHRPGEKLVIGDAR
jgi:hypothetical protein